MWSRLHWSLKVVIVVIVLVGSFFLWFPSSNGPNNSSTRVARWALEA